MNNSVSIIICFYNAGTKLIPTINSIKTLDTATITNCELILVDNNSNDNSCKIIHEVLEGFTGFNWKIVRESKPGLSNARLKGIAEAKYDFYLFCDDDNWLSPDYLLKAMPILHADDSIAVLGGKGTAVSDVLLPEWFKSHENFYAVGKQMPQSGQVIGTRNVVYGAGMIVRKAAWNHILSRGFSFFALGRTANNLSSGEDSEMCLAFQIAGFKIWYSEDVTFKHYIEPNRLTIEYINNLKKGISDSVYVIKFYRLFLQGYRPQITKYFWLKEFVHTLKNLLIDILKIAPKSNIKRNTRFSVYLLKRRKKYNSDVSSILRICEALQI